jgi:hypothetical protein
MRNVFVQLYFGGRDPDETKTPISWLAIFILKGARGTSTVLHMCASHALVYSERHVPNRKHFWLV